MATMTTTTTTANIRPSHRHRRDAVLSPLDLYLREIGDVPLLTADEEKDLARRIVAGDEAARDWMVRCNLRLVVRIAKSYVGKGLSFPDLIEEGNIGLLCAARGFKPEAGTRFSTYASRAIKQSIRRALENQVRPIRVPAYLVQRKYEWQRAVAELWRSQGRRPEHAEVAAALGLSADQSAMVVRAIHLGRARTWGEALGEIVMDGSGDHPSMAGDEQRSRVRLMLAEVERMDERAAAVLRMRFGIDGAAPMNLRQIGDVFGMCRERARQIERDGLLLMAEIAGRDGYWGEDGAANDGAAGPGAASW